MGGLNDIYYETTKRDAFCRGCDKKIIKKQEKVFRTYSPRNRDQEIYICNDCIDEFIALRKETNDKEGETKMTETQLKHYLIKEGILIGSRQWGGETTKSDYDLVFDTNKLPELRQMMSEAGVYCEDMNGISNSVDHKMYNVENIKLYLCRCDVINIITYKTKDLSKIIELNKIVKALSGTEISDKMSKDKNVRIRVIETFLDVLFVGEISNPYNTPELIF